MSKHNTSFKERIHHGALFFKNFLKNPLRNASIIPSSTKASRAMLEGIDFDKINTVVELGPGTGVFTQILLEKVKPTTKIIVLELEKSYAKRLQNKFDNKVEVICDNAIHLKKILDKKDIKKVDLIISGLPIIYDVEKRRQLHSAIKYYTDKGSEYRFFTYHPWLTEKTNHVLDVQKYSFVLTNIPPFWVYTIRR